MIKVNVPSRITKMMWERQVRLLRDEVKSDLRFERKGESETALLVILSDVNGSTQSCIFLYSKPFLASWNITLEIMQPYLYPCSWYIRYKTFPIERFIKHAVMNIGQWAMRILPSNAQKSKFLIRHCRLEAFSLHSMTSELCPTVYNASLSLECTHFCSVRS